MYLKRKKRAKNKSNLKQRMKRKEKKKLLPFGRAPRNASNGNAESAAESVSGEMTSQRSTDVHHSSVFKRRIWREKVKTINIIRERVVQWLCFDLFILLVSDLHSF